MSKRVTASERLQQWCDNVEALVELECRPDPIANFTPRWWGKAQTLGNMAIIAESGPCETAEDCAQTLIDRLQLGGISVPATLR